MIFYIFLIIMIPFYFIVLMSPSSDWLFRLFLAHVFCFFIVVIIGIVQEGIIENKYECVNLEYKSIHQDIEGDYFVITQDYEKHYPKIKIIDGESRFVEKVDKTINIWIPVDSNEKVLYLNVKDVER